MKKQFAAVIAITGWLALIGQLYLLIQNSPWPLGEVIIRYFSYFTILGNILVATYLTSVSLQKDNTAFFMRAGVQTAITVYIIVVGIIYNLVLRFLWAPQGLQRVVDELLHTLLPVLAVVYWVKYVPKATLRYKDCFTWMLFPFAYILYVIIRGAASGFYPYAFIDVTLLGYPRALLNGSGIVFLFMGLSLFLTALAQWNSRRQPVKQ